MSTQPLNNNAAIDRSAIQLLMNMRDEAKTKGDEAVFQLLDNTITAQLARSSTSLTPQQPIPMPIREPRVVSSVSYVEIDVSGDKGKNGTPGAAASTGVKGYNGTDGEDAGNIRLRLKIKDEVVAAEWDKNGAFLKSGDPNALISLKAVGGKGGNGGHGGKGGDGKTGANGRNATQVSVGANGQNGTPGGAGGPGGIGGDGGRGGNVEVHLNPEDGDLLMLLNTPETKGGAQGDGGVGGKGGTGGKGGKGGMSHSWTTTTYNTRTVYDGRGGSRTETYATTVNHFNPGGSDGSRGPNGKTGYTGTSGNDGRVGSFQIILGGAAYSSRYDLKVTVAKIVDLVRGNPADIYEPGEQVNLSVTVQNTGGMATPPQEIEISLCPTGWIAQGNSSVILEAASCLPIGGSHTFATSFSFRVKNKSLVIGEPLNIQEALTYHARLLRVNKSFSSVSQQKDLVHVRYPVQISPLEGKILTAFNDESTLSLSLQNMTSTIMGKDGPQKRRVFVTFEISENEDIKSKDVKLVSAELFREKIESDLHEPNKFTVEVDHLLPKGKEYLAVSFRFINPDLPPLSTVQVAASLHLGFLDSDAPPRCIQKRTMTLQFAEKYRYNHAADVLLVTYAGIERNELEAWKMQLRTMHLAFSIWNISYYKNIRFGHLIEGTKETLESHFAKKTVILLNQPYQEAAGSETVVAKLPNQEIFRLGNTLSIKTYVVGQAIIPKDQCSPRAEDIDKAPFQAIYGRVVIASNQRENFETAVKETAERIRVATPLQRNFIVKTFNPQKVDGVFKYQLGTIKICPAGLLSRATVLSVPFGKMDNYAIASPENTYGIFKMLHFERKLSLFPSVSPLIQLCLEEAIISDFADELYPFYQDTWTGDWNQEALKGSFYLLNLFLRTHWSEICGKNEHLIQGIRRIMLKFRAFAESIPEDIDALPNRRRRFLAGAVVELIDHAFQNLFGPLQTTAAEYAIYKEPFSRMSKEQLWNVARSPNFKKFYQDNWEGRSLVV